MTLPKRLAVLGGTGFVGRSLCERLVRAGDGGGSIQVVVPTRRAMHANSVRFLPGVEVHVADVHDDGALVRALVGCDAVVNLVAILHGGRAAFDRVHVSLPQRLARACRTAGLRRVVHVSALGLNGNEPSHYLRTKATGEAALKAAALDLTLLRPSVIFGAGDRFLNLFARLQAVFPLMPLAGADARFQPVWVEDVAEAIVRCLDDPATIGRTIECAGPEVLTLAELVRLAGRWSGHERPVLPLPAALGRLQALAMELLPGPPLMSRDNLDSMRVPNVASEQLPGLASLGIRPATLAAVVPAYLGRQAQGRARLDALRARAGRSQR
jgi:NADH dehydrogenase